jgi:DNA-binding transcriptional regulator YhcF (GntR family)
MPPFSISLRSGVPIYEQVIYAVTRAIVNGELRAGDSFPSVRALSQDLKINPNTSHKIVAALIERGLLDVRPGIGTVVSSSRRSSASEGRVVLDEEAERLVVEARRTGLSLQDVITSIRTHWTRTVRRVG